MTKDSLRTALMRFVFSVLLSTGFLFPLLGILDLNGSWISVILIIIVSSLLLSAVSLSVKSSVVAAVILPLVFLLWLLFRQGNEILSEVFKAIMMQLKGLNYAMPLVASDTVIILSLFLSLCCFLLTVNRTGRFFSLFLCVGMLLLIWVKDEQSMLLFTLPALIGAFSLFILDRHEEASPLRIFFCVSAVVIGAFFLTPRDGIISPKMKLRADELRQNIMDRLFYTEPRDVFSIASEGYYPQGNAQLGGSAEPSDNPVMQVSSPRTVYLRGISMNRYNGRCWLNTIGGRRYLWDSRNMKEQRIMIFDQALPASVLDGRLTASGTVSVRMLKDNASTVFSPQRIRNIQAGGDLILYYTPSSEIFSTRNLQAGDTWTVTAPLFVAGDPGLGTLIDSVASSDDPQWDSVIAVYTDLPAHLEQPVVDLALSVTSGLVSPYDKAFAIQSWLSRNYKYNLHVEDQPSDIDFVTHFLLNTREGYCTYFASAMTVMCRMIGLPARYVEGFIVEPDNDGNAIVTGKNAHAWTEVYFKGFGWLTFDATPHQADWCSAQSDAALPQNTSEPEPKAIPDSEELPDDRSDSDLPDETSSPALSEDPETPPPDEPQPSGSDEDTAELSVNEGSAFPWWILILAVLILLLSVRIFMTSPDYLEKHAGSDRESYDIRIADISRLLRSAGFQRRSGETPMAFTRRLDSEDHFNVTLSPMGECISLCSYANVEPIGTDIDLIRETALLLRSELSPLIRLRCFVSRLADFKKDKNLL